MLETIPVTLCDDMSLAFLSVVFCRFVCIDLVHIGVVGADELTHVTHD